MTKSFTEIARTLKSLDMDDESVLEYAEYLRKRKTVRKLAALRVAKNMTQAEVGKKIGRSQSGVSRIESTPDDRLKVSDFHRYGKAVGVKVDFVIN